jgi:hypothetical protein
MKTTNDLRKYTESTYPKISKSKFDFIKSGPYIVMFLIDRTGSLQKETIFNGPLSSCDEIPALKKHIEDKVKKVMEKWEYC